MSVQRMRFPGAVRQETVGTPAVAVGGDADHETLRSDAQLLHSSPFLPATGRRFYEHEIGARNVQYSVAWCARDAASGSREGRRGTDPLTQFERRRRGCRRDM